jgi:hypothetical protein
LALCYERLERPGEALLEYDRVVHAAATPFTFRAETSLEPDLAHWRGEVLAFGQTPGSLWSVNPRGRCRSTATRIG